MTSYLEEIILKSKPNRTSDECTVWYHVERGTIYGICPERPTDIPPGVPVDSAVFVYDKLGPVIFCDSNPSLQFTDGLGQVLLQIHQYRKHYRSSGLMCWLLDDSLGELEQQMQELKQEI